MAERDPVNVHHEQARHRQKVRLGYVLCERDGWSLVAMGRSREPRSGDYFKLEARSRDGRSMKLANDTYFTAELMEWFENAKVNPRWAYPCSLQTFKKLRAVFQAALSRRPALAAPPTQPLTSGPDVTVVRKRPRR